MREDYSAEGNAWNYLPHDQARSRAYRWGEDGLGGFCDRKGQLCFALAFWNGNDPILKERLFGLTNEQGNHGEDVKKYYFYSDNAPTHSYMKWLYKYPQQAFPYTPLVEENARRNKQQPELELLDTGVFDGDRYFDIVVEYAKASPDDICIRIHITSKGVETAAIEFLPTLWFRNTWTWTGSNEQVQISKSAEGVIRANSQQDNFWLFCDSNPPLLFTENETNLQRLYGSANTSPYVKDAFHKYIIYDQYNAIDPKQIGTKAAAYYHLEVAAETQMIQLRFTKQSIDAPFNQAFSDLFKQLQTEADTFYESLTPALNVDVRNVQRQAFAGLLWSKQFYNYDVHIWLNGDLAEPAPSSQRLTGRNTEWWTLYEFLSPHGIRAVSRYHKDHPYNLDWNSTQYQVDYESAESTTNQFGSNSNWREPVWFPLNFLLIEALQKFHHYLGDDLKVEYPIGSGIMFNLWEVAAELEQRLISIFLRGQDGQRPVYRGTTKFQQDSDWRDLILFYKYFTVTMKQD